MTARSAADFPAIRRFFVEPQTTYSLQDLATLWQLPLDVVSNIYDDELERYGMVGGDGRASFRVPWPDAAATSVTFDLLRPRDVELALGSNFELYRSEGWRTLPVRIHLPRFAIDLIAAGAFRPHDSVAVQVERFILQRIRDDGAVP